MALQARDEGLSPPVTGVNLNAPATVHPDVVPDKYKSVYKAYEQNKNAALLDKQAMDFFLGNFLLPPQYA